MDWAIRFFDDSVIQLEHELDNMSSHDVTDVRSSMLYKALNEFMETLKSL